MEINEITQQSEFDSVCKDKTCLLLFVPDIRDSGKEKRNDLIALFKRLSEQQIRSMFQYGWIAVMIYKPIVTNRVVCKQN